MLSTSLFGYALLSRRRDLPGVTCALIISSATTFENLIAKLAGGPIMSRFLAIVDSPELAKTLTE